MDYQSAGDEVDIVARQTDRDHGELAPKVVELVRATREHSEIRIGSSVRGAIDLILLADELAELRGRPVTDREVGLDAALTALSGRIRLQESSNASPETVITELWDRIMGRPDDAEGTVAEPPQGEPGKARAPRGAPTTTS
jgi:MoxR-like ATPase